MTHLKKMTMICAVAIISSTNLWAEESQTASTDPIREAYGTSLQDKLFVVETSPKDESEAVNRVSGKVDRGYSSPEQSYKSEKTRRKGPFDENPQEKTSQVLS